MAGDGYKVDLSALDNVIKKVNGIIADLGKTSEDTRSKTYLPSGALGGAGFGEAVKLTAAHDDMKGSLEDVVRHLESVMDEFGAKTKRAHGAYQDAEADTAGALHGASNGSSSSTVPTSTPGSMA
ncbi:hypothetical protein [Streptomyces sp. NPDC057694]|uniref:hypothetical protein n=1 Tax=unclassified Streptomyces TaxID=2593676 RepID=UPI0036AC374D